MPRIPQEGICPTCDFLRVRHLTRGYQAEARLQQEVARVAAYLHSSTEEKLLKDIEEQLLANHQIALLDKEETGINY